MATYYLQHGLYTYAATPTWGTAQEGDGTAKGAATPATGSLLINAVATAGNTITIMGVTLTAVASGATAAQFNVGATTTAQADNIATAINAATGTVSSSVANTTHQLRNMLYARGPSNGAAANTVEIMTRAGSANFNHATNSAVAISSSGWSSAPTITQFSGGAGGAWGYFFNTAAIWPSSLAIGAYGSLYRGAGLGPLAGNPMTSADLCLIRSGSTDTVLSFPNSSVNVAFSALGTFIIDDGTEWSGDTGAFILRMSGSSATQTFYYLPTVTGRLLLTSRNQARAKIQAVSGSAQTVNINSGIGANVQNMFHWDNWTFEDNSTSGSINIGMPMVGSAGGDVVISNLRYVITANKWVSPLTLLGAAYNNNTFTLENSTFDYSAFTGVPSGGFITSLSFLNGIQNYTAIIRNCRVICGVKPYLVTGTTNTSNSATTRFSAENIDGLQPAAPFGFFTTAPSTYGPEDGTHTGYFLQAGVGSPRQYRLTTQNLVIEWAAGAGYPYLNSQFPDATFWSYSIQWPGSNHPNTARQRGIEALRLYSTATQSGLQTVSLEMLFESSIASSLNSGHMSLQIAYVDTAGNIQNATNYSLTSTTSLSSGSSSWTLNSYGTYVARKIAITLPSAIKINTEVDVVLRLHSVNPRSDGAPTTFFVNPDLALS